MKTIKNFNDVDFVHIHRVERISETEILLRTNHQLKTTYTYDNPEDCLSDFLILREKQKKAGIKRGTN